MQYFHSNTSYYLQLLLEGQALVPLEAWMMDYILDGDMALGLDALSCINVGGLASAKRYLMIFTNTFFGNKTLYHHDVISKFVCHYRTCTTNKNDNLSLC